MHCGIGGGEEEGLPSCPVCYFLAGWPWVYCSTSLCLSFFIYKMETIQYLLQRAAEKTEFLLKMCLEHCLLHSKHTGVWTVLFIILEKMDNISPFIYLFAWLLGNSSVYLRLTLSIGCLPSWMIWEGYCVTHIQSFNQQNLSWTSTTYMLGTVLGVGIERWTTQKGKNIQAATGSFHILVQSHKQ